MESNGPPRTVARQLSPRELLGRSVRADSVTDERDDEDRTEDHLKVEMVGSQRLEGGRVGDRDQGDRDRADTSTVEPSFSRSHPAHRNSAGGIDQDGNIVGDLHRRLSEAIGPWIADDFDPAAHLRGVERMIGAES
jgi:hypothetical protein